MAPERIVFPKLTLPSGSSTFLTFSKQTQAQSQRNKFYFNVDCLRHVVIGGVISLQDGKEHGAHARAGGEGAAC